MQKKYILCPGKVLSITDGDEHYISAYQLANLYGVRMEECIVGTEQNLLGMSFDDKIFLYPRQDGKYEEYRKRLKDGHKRKYAGARN